MKTRGPRGPRSPQGGMDNRGKGWSLEDDQKLIENPELDDQYFSQLMGRTEFAIRCRRSHIAARLHRQSPGTALRDCVQIMGGDLAQAERLLEQWRPARGWAQLSEAEQIAHICTAIQEEQGRLGALWRDPDLAPCLVRHYAGFEAYARAVQSW